MKFASLGSGSEGNALLISAASGTTRTTVMLDCGFAVRETERRLARLDVTPGEIAGIVVTHEHQDHIGGVFRFARRHKVPVWLSYGTFQAAGRHAHDVDVRFCRDGETLAIGDLELHPFTVPHDAREPLQYAASDGDVRLGILTDVGHATDHMIAALGGCDALLLECNHDPSMLAKSDYPFSLKRRIGGDYGHLSNEASAAILAALDRSRLQRVVAAHLSRQNNTPELACAALRTVAGAGTIDICVASQDEGCGWFQVAS